MRVFVPREPVERSRFGAFALEQGFEVSVDMPWTNGIRYTTWVRGDDRVTFATDAASGGALVRVDEAEGASLGEMLEARFGGLGPEALIAEARAAAGSRAKIRAMYRMSALSLVAGPFRGGAVELYCERLLDEEPLVRWAAARLLRTRIERPVERALAAAAETYPDLLPAAESMRALCDASEEGTLYDAPTDAHHELVERAREGAEKGQWKRVAKAAEAILAKQSNQAQGLYYRALAYEQEGEPLLALALLGASIFEVESDRRVDRYMKRKDAAAKRRAEKELDEDEELDEDDEELDEDDKDDEDEELDDKDGFLAKARAARDALRERVAAMDLEARRPRASAVVAWMNQMASDACWSHVGAARAIRGAVPELDAFAGFVASSYMSDLAGLTEVLERVPDAPSVLYGVGRMIAKTDPAAARRHYEEALRRIRAGKGARSPEAELIEAHTAGRSREGASEATVLEALTMLVYGGKAWEEAERLSDELARVAPDAMAGWQIRALARTFAEKHEEAALAYDDALRELDRIYRRGDEEGWLMSGADPRPQMRFNRACVLAKLGRRDEALEELKRAIRLDDKWLEEAKGDDYWEAYWQDPEFLAITSGDPRALVTSKERDPAHIRRLIDRAKGLAYNGKAEQSLEQGQRAAELAEWAGQTGLLVEALAGLGRTFAYEEDVGQGLDLVERAWVLAEPEGAVPPDVRAETAHTRGVVLHLAGELDRAEEAYHRALSLRRDAYGESDPVLAKSYGDLARLEVDRGAGSDVVRATIDRGVSVLERFLSGHAERGDAWAEAALDLATLLVNRARIEAAGGDVARATDSLGSAVLCLEEVSAVGYSGSPAFLENAGQLARGLAQELRSPEGKAIAWALAERLEALLLPGSPEERRERLYWRRLRRLTAMLRRRGVSDAAIAGMLTKALRGGGELEEPFRSIPELAGLPAELGRRAADYPTFVVMAAMALSTAEAGSSLDEALENLEELCVAQLLSKGAEGGEGAPGADDVG